MIDDENWVELQVEGKPPPVDRYEYWNEAPPELSERCIWWLHYLADNDLTKQQLLDLTPSCANYSDSAEALGVYLWEWHHILYHVLTNKIEEKRDRETWTQFPCTTSFDLNTKGNTRDGLRVVRDEDNDA